MHQYFRLCVLLALLISSSISRAADVVWSAFDWQQTEIVAGAGKVRAAIVVPILVNGVECNAQLDTGAPSKVIWHRGADASLPSVETIVEVAGLRHAVKAKTPQLVGLESNNCKNEIIATIGNAYFEEGTLSLDLKENRLAFSPTGLLSKEAKAQPINYAQWSGNNGGHIVIEVILPNGKLGYAMLDTGAASFSMSAMSEADWNTLTENAPLQQSANVKEYKVNSWGKKIPCFETLAPGSIVIAQSFKVEHFRASYCVQDAFKPGQKLVGLLGLRDLQGKQITIDYRSRRWLISN